MVRSKAKLFHVGTCLTAVGNQQADKFRDHTDTLEKLRCAHHGG